MNLRRKQQLTYLLADLISSELVWLCTGIQFLETAGDLSVRLSGVLLSLRLLRASLPKTFLAGVFTDFHFYSDHLFAVFLRHHY